MKTPSLRSKMREENLFQIRPARAEDWASIERLLSNSERRYMALEWWTVQEWIGSPTLLLAKDSQRRTAGFMLTVIGDGPVAWIRAFGVTSNKYIMPLLEASAQAVEARGIRGLAFLGDEDWIASRLREVGFQEVNRVITLHRRALWPIQFGPPDLGVRTATTADVDSILAVDHAAFAPMWWYDRDVFVRALSVAYSFSVAYMHGECVGYQLSTLRGNRGHIVRLAVHPRWQRQGIGGRLLSEAMRILDEAQAELVTVNTQEDNRASLQLYSLFSFDRVGKPWTVWFQALE